jgi:hypothetical protein
VTANRRSRLISRDKVARKVVWLQMKSKRVEPLGRETPSKQRQRCSLEEEDQAEEDQEGHQRRCDRRGTCDRTASGISPSDRQASNQPRSRTELGGQPAYPGALAIV